MDNVIGAATMT